MSVQPEHVKNRTAQKPPGREVPGRLRDGAAGAVGTPTAVQVSAYSATSVEFQTSEERERPLQQPSHARELVANRYRIDRVLGEGGMGIVYACTDEYTGRRVAVKQVTLPEGKLRDDYISWFYKESRALAALDHPGIVRAHDFGQLEDGSPYLAMELIIGHSLHDLLSLRLSYPLIWHIANDILSALAHAHAHRVIHGDLKPSNVIVREREDAPPKVSILDFGLAWLKEDPHDERLDGEKALVVSPHAGAGTPGYMAPEQIMHELHHIEGGTDLYALGCILYKLLSGRPPWNGRSKDLLRWHAYEEPPRLQPVLDVPAGVVDFVMRLLRKRPWQRYEFAAEAQRAWDLVKPVEPLEPSVWRFPPVPASPSAVLSTEAPALPSGKRTVAKATGLLSIRPSPLVGREDIRELLISACDDVLLGRGAPHRLALLLGPAGVGKTRIAEWLFARAHERGCMVPLVARYRRVRGTLDGMLGAVTQHFNFENADRATIEQSLLTRWNVAPNDQRMRAWVAGTAEWLRPTPPGEQPQIGPSGVRFTIDTLDVRRQVIRFVLRRIANGRPLLFFLDDLHNASSATIDGLLKIYREETDQRIFIVATVRTEDVRLGADVARRLRELRDQLDGEVIEVGQMDRETTCQLLRASLPLERRAVIEAARRSRGFPLFALQQLHAWAHAGKMDFWNGQYRVAREVLAVRPKTTSDLWESRLAALPSEHHDAALAIAPLGIDIRRSVILALFQALDIPGEAAISSLQKAELIVPRDQARYSWPHALLQEHLFRKLTRRFDSERFFRAAAQALAQHPLANTRRVVRQRVVNLLYARQAERAASTFFSFLEQSWNGVRQPAATLADLDLFNGHLSGRMRALCWRWRAEALQHSGRFEEARQLVEAALEALHQHGNALDIAHCERLLGQLLGALGAAQEGLGLVETSLLTFVKNGDMQGRALSEYVAAEIHYSLGNHEKARSLASEGERHFAELGHSVGRGECLLLLSSIAHSEGATRRSQRLTLEARAEFEQSGYRLGIAQTTASLAHIDHRLANFSSAWAQAEEALSLFGSLHTLQGQASCERLLAMIGIDTGQLETARQHALRAERLYRGMADPWGTIEATLLLAQVALAANQPGEAREPLDAAAAADLVEPEPKQHELLTRAWFELARGEADAALRYLQAAERAFERPWQVGDHTPHLLTRLLQSRLAPPEASSLIENWQRQIHDHVRREGD